MNVSNVNQSQNQIPPQNWQDPDEINLLEYFYALVKHKWLIIGLTMIGLVAGYFAAAQKGQKFTSEAVIAPKDGDSPKTPSFSSFGALGGLMASQLNMAGNASLDKIDLLLKSRKFNAAMIDRYDLYPLIYPKMYDTTTNTWKNGFKPPKAQFAVGGISGCLTTKMEKNNTMTLSVKHKDSTFVKVVLADYLEYLNIYIREQVQNGAKENIEYLSKEMTAIPDPLVRTKIQELVANEYEKMMVVSKEAFVVIDSPFLSSSFKEKRLYPMVFAAGLFFMACLLIVFMHAFSSAQKTPEDVKLIAAIKKEIFRGPMGR